MPEQVSTEGSGEGQRACSSFTVAQASGPVGLSSSPVLPEGDCRIEVVIQEGRRWLDVDAGSPSWTPALCLCSAISTCHSRDNSDTC